MELAQLQRSRMTPRSAGMRTERTAPLVVRTVGFASMDCASTGEG